MKDSGWVKLHRKILSWGWYSDRDVRDVFIHLILTASHEKSVFLGKEINVGERVFGRISLAKEIGISEQTLRTCLTKLKSTSDITIKSYNKYSVVSIKNYLSYQKSTSESTNHQPANQPTTNHIQEYKNKEILDKSNNANAKGNIFINKILENFKERLGFNPTDPKPRFEAFNLVRRIRKLLKEIGREDTDEQVLRVIDKYFSWLDDQEWFSNVQNMGVIRRKFEIYQQNVINHLKPNVPKES